MSLVVLICSCAAAAAACTNRDSAAAGRSMAEIVCGGVWVRKDRDRIEERLPILVVCDDLRRLAIAGAVTLALSFLVSLL